MNQKPRVLVISDDPTSMVVLRRTLEQAGYQVHTAENPQAGLELLEQHRPQLVLLDAPLPSEASSCRTLAERGAAFDTPIILVTTRSEPEQVLAAFSVGASDHIAKPFTTQEVVARVNVHLRARQARTGDGDNGNQLEELTNKLARLSRNDPLTNVLNRRALDEFVIEQSVRLQAEGRPYSVIMIDLDHSRSYNEAFGRESGDACLHRAAEAIVGACRATDVVGRCGSDEFVVVCPDTDSDETIHLAERIRRAIWSLAICSPKGASSARLTASIGVAPAEPGSWEAVLQRAEAAVQVAKKAGRNMVQVDRGRAEHPDTPRTPSAENLTTAQANVDPPPLDVLVVDDDPTNRMVCRGCLQHIGYRVREAEDGCIALARVAESSPDVIIMDVMMPNMDGLECTKTLRANPDTREIPIIIVSALSRTEDILAGLQAGADEYLAKPIRSSELILRVQSMARLHRERLDLLRSYEERGKQMKLLTRLVQFCRAVSSSKSSEEILRHTVDAVADVMGCRRVSIMLPDENEEFLHIANSLGLDPEVVQSTAVAPGEPIAGRVYSSGQPVIVNTMAEAGSLRGDYGAPYFASVPLISAPLDAAGHVVGVLNATDKSNGTPFEVRDLEYIELISKVAGTAVHDVRMREARDQASDSIMVALASLAECRDTNTGRHLERVTHFCLMLAQALRKEDEYRDAIDDEFLHKLERSVPLHDIGKVAIPDEILLLPGKLNDEQMALMRTHAEIGANTIQSLMDRAPEVPFLEMAMEIARYHHERYDGHGYPHGLRGKAIPLEARITAVADVYDALVTRRPYKEPFSHETAVAIIRKGSGTQFDPEVVNAFLQQERAFADLAEALADGSESETPPVLSLSAC